MVAISNAYRVPERPNPEIDIQRQLNGLRQKMTSLEGKLSEALEALKAERAAARAAEATAMTMAQECALTLVAERTDTKMIAGAVAMAWGTTVGGLISPRRSRNVAYPRHAAFLLSRKYCSHMSLPMIGRAFGKRDHTTVMHGIANAERLIKESPSFAARFARAEALILERANG